MSEEPHTDDYDVVIVGAGVSGIDAAYRIKQRNPGVRYLILERRSQIGGTWDLFRYPGVRSDSSIFTFSYPYEPWTRPDGLAEGDQILEYLTHTADKYGIAEHIRFHSHVRSADWDSTTNAWTITVEQDGVAKTYRAQFLFFATGYYNYDQAYTPNFPGIDEFRGPIVHPQFWPEDLDYAGKNIVVIGSGATAISLIPALSEDAAKVTMLQRTPTYSLLGKRIEPVSEFVRAHLPPRTAHVVLRMYIALIEAIIWFLARKTPEWFKSQLRKTAKEQLPAGYDIDTHFNPPYNPWDQRLCIMIEGDLYQAICDGCVEMVTDHIDHVDADGIVLRSGGRVDADIIVTATGLQLQALGGVAISIDGADIKPQDRFVYKAHMLEDVPNLFWCVGYTNASWTLRADMTARATAKLIAYMRRHGYTAAYPHRDGDPMPEKPSWDIQAGYVLRNPHALPKSGTRRPWNVRQNYFADAIEYNFFDRISESMVFVRKGSVVESGRSTPHRRPTAIT